MHIPPFFSRHLPWKNLEEVLCPDAHENFFCTKVEQERDIKSSVTALRSQGKFFI